MTPVEMAQYIDHTLLKPDATADEIRRLCDEAMKYKFASVCVNPSWVEYCYHLINGSIVTVCGRTVNICTVIGFPFGANRTETKIREAQLAFDQGAKELDMVINIGNIKSEYWQETDRDILQVRLAIPYAILKVIIETCLLTDFEKEYACMIVRNAGADFVKTSTGFSKGGATVEDVALMRKTVGEKIGVKAAGGIKDFSTAKAMLEAGANRLGCSASVAIVSENPEEEK